MPDYMVKFIGHIDVHKRPQGFPAELVQVEVLQDVDKDALVTFITKRLKEIIYLQGMGASLDPAALQDPAKIDTNRAFVPMHMLTHLTSEVIQIQRDVPTEADIDAALAAGKPN